MDEARMSRLAELFDQASAMAPAARAEFVNVACGTDDALRRDLCSLLDAHESSAGFFDDLAAQVLSPASAAIVARSTATLLPELETVLKGSYRIERELGGGSMSRVFLAEELGLGRNVVIKVLPPELAVTMSGERFRREIQLAAQLQHPHIVPLLTGDATGRLLYYTMPFIAGESLRARLARDGTMSVGDATKIWRDMLDALAHAHAHRVVHRDIKPGNILLSGRNALVADFGIARAIESAAGEPDTATSGLAIGTPAYMAPEQVGGEREADSRVDIYAAALVMYEMLEGRLPFTGSSSREVLAARLVETPRPIGRADCSPELAAMVLQCLATNPAERPESAEILLAELETLPALPRAGARPGQTVARRVLVYGLAALVLGAALAARYLRSGTAQVPASAAPAPSLAVIPFTDITLEPGDAVLADGMTEELIAILSRGGSLRVAASTSVRALQDRQLAVRQIAESLGASHLLEGSLQKTGSNLWMQVQLVDARDGATRWSATFDRQIGDVFALQDDIARAVSSELHVPLAGGGRGSGRRGFTHSVAAYDWYLRGRNTTLLRTDAGRRQGIEYFNRAIAVDSTFAAAYAGLVWMYLNEAGSTPGDHRAWRARAEAAALKAVALGDTVAEAHSALGWARMVSRNLTAAEAEFTRAIALDPDVFRGDEGLARLYMLTGRPAEQLAAARRGLDVDPFSTQAIREMALALNMNGRCDETLELLRPLKDLTPPASVAGVIRGQCYARKQMWPEAIAELRWATKSGTGARAALAFLGYALARGGETGQARVILSDLLAGRKDSHGAFGIAVVYIGFRNYDQAFTWLARSVEEDSWRVYIMDPLFEDLHRDPRFARLWPSALGGAPAASQNR